MAKMTRSELLAVLQAAKRDALSAQDSAKLSEERQRALDYYNGDMTADMPATQDRSKAVSSDVLDTVEGLLPGLMEVFAGGDEVLAFSPVGPEDVAAAEQETDYVNHVYMDKNPGFLVTYTFIKDALLSKNGIVKVVWEQTEKDERETYLSQPEDVFALLAADPEMEIVEHTANEDGTHDVTLSRRREYGCAKVYNVPPEEYGIARNARSCQDAEYQYHEVRVSVASLLDEGWDEDVVNALPDAPTDETSEEVARNTVDEADGLQADLNKVSRLVVKTEHYALLDYEGNGKPALYRIVTGGKDSAKVLTMKGEPAIERIDMPPFASMTPFIMPHRFFGKSVADLVIEVQRIKTALLRGLLDNVYLANNQRVEIAEENAGPRTLEDWQSNRPGAPVRTKRAGGIIPIPNQPIGDFVYPALEYMDMVREWRTGVVKQGQGIDADALQNQSATAVQKVYNAAQAKMKLIARIFAETGFKDMFKLLHATIRKNDRQQSTVRLRNQWVAVDPRNWKTRDDMTVSVGLGSGGKQEQIAFWAEVIKLQAQMLQQQQLNLVKPPNLYASVKKFMELGGEKAAETYFSDPEDPNNPPPEPQPDPKMMEMQAKMEIEKLQAEADMATQRQKTEAELAVAREKAALEQQKMLLELDVQRQSAEIELQSKRVDADIKRRMAQDKMVERQQAAALQMQVKAASPAPAQ